MNKKIIKSKFDFIIKSDGKNQEQMLEDVKKVRNIMEQTLLKF
jgi:hypothetical protein